MLRNAILQGWRARNWPSVRALGTLKFGPDRIAPASAYTSIDPLVPVKLRLEDSGFAARDPISVQTMLQRTAQGLPDVTAMRIKRDGKWIKWTYPQYFEDVTVVAKGFMALGLERGHGVGIMGLNTPEYHIAFLAATFGGGVGTGIYTTNYPSTIKYICEHTPVDILLVGHDNFLNLAKNDCATIHEALPTVKAFIIWEGISQLNGVLTWEDLFRLGNAENDKILEEVFEDQSVNQGCCVVYTSGTTGNPKGVVLSHDNVTWTGVNCLKTYGFCGGGRERALSFLPNAHMAGLLSGVFMAIPCGGEIVFASKTAMKGTLIDELKECKPTGLFSVPRIFEKIYDRMVTEELKASLPKRKLLQWAKKHALRHHEKVMKTGDLKKTRRYRIAKKLLRKIHVALGLEIAAERNTIVLGAAPLTPETEVFFESLDMVLLKGYGSTETAAPHTTTTPGVGSRRFTVGQSFPAVSNKIVNPDPDTGIGEIATQGRNVFMGYLREEERTKNAFSEDGYYLTGDLGKFDADEFLTVTGRKKELLVTSNGKNIAPIPIEDRLKKELRYIISNVVVIGDQRHFLTCLMTLRVEMDMETQSPTDRLDESAQRWCKKNGVRGIKTVDDFINGPESERLMEGIQAGVDRANQEAESNPFVVKKWKVLPTEFSIETEELTPTMKIKRSVIARKYAPAIDQMYSES